jgi:chitinase
VLSVGNQTVTERDKRSVTAVFTVSLSRAATKTVTVGYATVGETATSGVDFSAVSGTLTFAPGVTVRTFGVPVHGDRKKEGNETFAVTLRAPVNAGIGDGRGVGTILDDDDRR